MLAPLPYEVPEEIVLNAEAQMMMVQIFNVMKTDKSFSDDSLPKAEAFFYV
jgi:hypothetical protein